MKITKKTNKEERQIVTAMIVNEQVLARIASKYDKEMFPSPWSNLVSGWCVNYFRKYKKAPRKAIETLFNKWASDSEDQSTIDLVESYIKSLSRQYDEESHEINADYVIDTASAYFNRVRLKRTLEKSLDWLEQGKLDKAEEVYQSHRRIEMGTSAASNPYQEMEVHKRTRAKAHDPLITFDDAGEAMQRFFLNLLRRDTFYVFQGPEKGKKSFWMQDIVHRAVKARRKVLYYQVGDMSEDQITERIQARICGRPITAGKWREPRKIIERRGMPPKVKFRKHFEKKELSLRDIAKAQERFNQNWLRARKTEFLKMECLSNLSMDEILGYIEKCSIEENWVPDIIVLDYIDLIDPPRFIKEQRDQINHIWRQARIISQKYHLCFITGTQANAQSYRRESQDRSSFSNDKRKNAHVTGIIGLNQPSDELEEMELMKLNWAVGPRSAKKPRPVWCAGSLDIANPCVMSC